MAFRVVLKILVLLQPLFVALFLLFNIISEIIIDYNRGLILRTAPLCYAAGIHTVIIAKVREVHENIKRNRLIWRIIQLWCFHHYHIVISHNTI